MGPSERVTVTNMDQYNSILMIESLSPDHNGNYSCVARNLAAEVSHTQRLVVHGNPPLGPLHFCPTTACPPEIRMSLIVRVRTRLPTLENEAREDLKVLCCFDGDKRPVSDGRLRKK